MKNYDLLKVVATKLNGLQYPLREVHLKDLREYCKQNGIVMCFGSSDDLMELDGAISDEYGCYDGGTICIDENGKQADANKYYPITAVWAKDDISWQYEFEPKHEVFTIYEDADIYCKGIVFFVDDLKRHNKMTNREHLNTLDDMHYAIAVIAKVSELELKNNNPEADVWESVNDTQMDFEDWLAEEYKENEE